MDTPDYSSFDAESFIQNLTNATGPEAVDQAFAGLAAKLPKEDYRRAIDAIENKMLEPFRNESAENVRRSLQASMQDSKSDDAQSVQEAQAVAQVFLNLSRAKGKETSPLVKSFVRAAAKLTDEQYNSTECVTTPLLALIDTAAKKPEAALKPNPFRPKKPKQ